MEKENLRDRIDISGAVMKLEDKQVRSRVSFFFQLAIAVVFGALVALMFFGSVTMQENSMEPTIKVGDTFLMNQLVYRFREPERGDIIVFRTNGNDKAALHISRVIALPGETIRIVNGRIYIDEVLFQENNAYPSITNPGLALDGIDVESEEYFVLGDNRNNSEDSRYSSIGKVKRKYIVGKLWFQTMPRNESGFV